MNEWSAALRAADQDAIRALWARGDAKEFATTLLPSGRLIIWPTLTNVRILCEEFGLIPDSWDLGCIASCGRWDIVLYMAQRHGVKCSYDYFQDCMSYFMRAEVALMCVLFPRHLRKLNSRTLYSPECIPRPIRMERAIRNARRAAVTLCGLQRKYGILHKDIVRACARMMRVSTYVVQWVLYTEEGK